MPLWHVERIVQDQVNPPLGNWYFTLKVVDLLNPMTSPQYVATSDTADVLDPCNLLNQVQDWLEVTDDLVDWATECPYNPPP